MKYYLYHVAGEFEWDTEKPMDGVPYVEAESMDRFAEVQIADNFVDVTYRYFVYFFRRDEPVLEILATSLGYQTEELRRALLDHIEQTNQDPDWIDEKLYEEMRADGMS